MGKGLEYYKCSEVVALATKRMTEPDIILEIIHIQHQSPHSILYHNPILKNTINSSRIHKQATRNDKRITLNWLVTESSWL